MSDERGTPVGPEQRLLRCHAGSAVQIRQISSRNRDVITVSPATTCSSPKVHDSFVR